MLESISVDKVDGLENIIDIRNIEKYNNNHINGSINIPFDKLLLNPGKYLNKNKVYYIYCQKGTQSRKMCLFLRKNGYRAINIEGGY